MQTCSLCQLYSIGHVLALSYLGPVDHEVYQGGECVLGGGGIQKAGKHGI